MTEKPPYEIPPLSEILSSTGTNGLTCASTFSGCGGSGLGLRWSGWSVPFASEFIPAAQDTYRANFSDSVLHTGDIRELRADEILDVVGRDVGELDLLEGSPPCSAFSMAGSRSAGWGEVKNYSDSKQRVDDLFDVWLELASKIKPRALLAENVPSLTTGKTAGAWKRIVAGFRAAGYVPQAAVLDASRLGVPQSRKRLIIVAFREDQTEEAARFSWPSPLPYRYSIRDACPWIGGPVVHDTEGRDEDDGVLVHKGGPNWTWVVQSASDPMPTIMTSGIAGTGQYALIVKDGVYADPETGEAIDIRKYAIYQEWAKLTQGQGSDKYLNLNRAHTNRPAGTFTQAAGGVSTAGVTHPTEPRKFTLLELRRLSGFPDDFTLTGSYSQRWERLGRAVVPPLYKAVGQRLSYALGGESL